MRSLPLPSKRSHKLQPYFLVGSTEVELVGPLETLPWFTIIKIIYFIDFQLGRLVGGGKNRATMGSSSLPFLPQPFARIPSATFPPSEISSNLHNNVRFTSMEKPVIPLTSSSSSSSSTCSPVLQKSIAFAASISLLMWPTPGLISLLCSSRVDLSRGFHFWKNSWLPRLIHKSVRKWISAFW